MYMYMYMYVYVYVYVYNNAYQRAGGVTPW